MSATKGEAINRGTEYEILAIAYLALKLLQDENIIDFTFELFRPNCGKFDDLCLHVTYKKGSAELFLLQLKHKEQQNAKLDATESFVIGKRKGFVIQQYAKAYDCMDNESRNGKLILFTNAKFEGLENMSNYKVVPAGNHFNSNIFQTEDVYQFTQLDQPQQSFFQHFYLLSGQRNLQQMEEETVRMFEVIFSSSNYFATCYIDFVRKVRFDNYVDTKLTRSTVILQLTDLLLGKYLIRTRLNGPPDDKIELLEEAMCQFDLVFIQHFDLNLLENRWSGKPPKEFDNLQQLATNHKLLVKDANFTDDVQLRSYSYFGEKPLFVRMNEESRPILQLLTRLWRSTEFTIKWVLLGDGHKDDFPGCKIFMNLADLRDFRNLYEAIMRSFELSLQGREVASLKTLATKFDLLIDDLITPDQLFQMLKEYFLVGTKIPGLPMPFIPRTLLRTDFNYKLLKDIEETIIVNCNGRSQEFGSKLKKEKIQFVDENSCHTDRSPVVILADREVNLPFAQLLLIRQNDLQWIENTVDSDSTNMFKCKLNAICAESGSGKTTLMKLLASNCPLSHWVVIVHLKEFRSFFKSVPSASAILKKILPQQTNFISSLLEKLIDERKIMFLVDGLDELNRDDVRSVTNTIKKLISENYKIWVFATKNFIDVLEKLHIYSIYDIKALEEVEMRHYIAARLKYREISADIINYIIDNIFKKDLPVDSTIDTMRTPLILFILTEVLIENKNLQQLDSDFILTKMYGSFIDGKVQHNLAKKYKIKFEEVDEDLLIEEAEYVQYLLTEYCKAALKICLEPDLTQQIDLKNASTFLKTIKNNKDFLGIVTKVNPDDSLVFIHHTFAVYFAATWLAQNYQELHDKITCLVGPRYKLVWYFLNLKLAENCPLHLAVLQNDVLKVEFLTEQYGATVDAGGRTPLHLCVSVEKRCKFPITPCAYCKNHETILKLVTRQEHVKKKDELLGFTALEYADHSLSLFCIEQLAHLSELQVSDLANHIAMDRLKRLVDPILYTASRSAYDNVLRCVLDSKVGPDMGDNNKRTALHETALYGRSTITKILLDAGANCEARDIFGGTPLILAARKGYLAVVKILVEHGANVNIADKTERSPLLEAAYWGHTPIVEYLMGKGANVNCRHSSGKTVLHKAVEKGHLDIVRILLLSRTNANAVDKHQRTALHYAASEGRFDIVQCLVEKAVDVGALDDNDKTAQEVAAEKGYQHIVELLKDVGEEVCRQQPPITFHKIVKMGQLGEIEEFLKEAEDIEEVDNNNQTALHIASIAGHTQVVKFLLERGANANARNSLGRTPLHLASQRGHVGVVELLLDKTKDPNVLDNDKLTPLHLAAFKGQTETVKRLVERGADVNNRKSSDTPLLSASRGGHNDVIDYLAEKGARVYHRNRWNLSCLHMAAKAGHKETVRHLIALYEYLLKFRDFERRTALHWAAEKGHHEVMKVLEDAGIDKESLDYYGQTASQIYIPSHKCP